MKIRKLRATEAGFKASEFEFGGFEPLLPWANVGAIFEQEMSGGRKKKTLSGALLPPNGPLGQHVVSASVLEGHAPAPASLETTKNRKKEDNQPRKQFPWSSDPDFVEKLVEIVHMIKPYSALHGKKAEAWDTVALKLNIEFGIFNADASLRKQAVAAEDTLGLWYSNIIHFLIPVLYSELIKSQAPLLIKSQAPLNARLAQSKFDAVLKDFSTKLTKYEHNKSGYDGTFSHTENQLKTILRVTQQQEVIKDEKKEKDEADEQTKLKHEKSWNMVPANPNPHPNPSNLNCNPRPNHNPNPHTNPHTNP